MKLNQHEAVQQVKDLALELGRAPTRSEFKEKHGWTFQSVFGHYSALLRAAGLTIAKAQTTKDFIRAHIGKRVSAELCAPVKPKVTTLWTPETAEDYRILVIGDVHAPVASEDALSGLYAVAEQFKPTLIAQAGDGFDMFAQSRFAKSLNWLTPKNEYECARAQLSEMWSTLKRIAPNAKLLQIAGNHGVRPMRKILEVAPDMEHFVDMERILGFEGVQTIVRPREIVMLAPDVELTHGDHGSKMIQYAQERGRNIVHGHDHRGVVEYVTAPSGRQLWRAGSGHLADTQSVPMQYTGKERPNWQRGCVLIDPLGPRFISL